MSEATAAGPGTALNPAQAEACDHLDGQLLVLAGPGTGKTRVITYRYMNLLARAGVSTENILVLTFTEKAAGEMHDRIAALCETGFSELQVSTFHAFAYRFLREEGHRLPIPRPFRIAQEVEKWQTMCAVLERLRPEGLYRLPRPLDVAPDLLKLIERAKQEMAGPVDYRRIAADMAHQHHLGAELQVEVAKVYEAHQDALLAAGLLDYDDTIYWAVRLLEDDPDALARWRARITHVMVDEFQDTNFSQLRLVELLAGENGNVAVVGDDDQSIYKFRGASVANLRRFRDTYPGLAIVRLEENYRSTRQVLAPAFRLVGHNTERVKKAVFSDRDGPAARLYLAPDRDHEVAWTVERIEELLGAREPVVAGEIAVLVRTNAQLRPFARALQRAGIPYQLLGGRGFLDQLEIKDLRALLQLVVDPSDTNAGARVLAMPGCGLSGSQILRLTAAARREEVTLEQAFAAARAAETADAAEAGAEETNPLVGITPDPGAWDRATRLLALVDDLRTASLRAPADEVVFTALERTRYVDLLDYPHEIQRIQAGANIQKFTEVCAAFCENAGGDATLGAFVEYLAAVEASHSEEAIAPLDVGADAIHLMTVHRSKGLEFTAVFLPGLVEERFPSRNRGEALPLPQELIAEEVGNRDPSVAEERRLAFVALTRARRHLFLSAAERYEGGKRWKPSRFLAEMGFLPAPDGTVVEALAAETAPEVEAPPPTPAAQAALPMGHPDVPELSVSYSQLDLYQQCPRAYQYRYVYRLPTRPSPEQEFGVAVHAALKEILEEAGAGQPPEAEAVAVFGRIFGGQRFSDPVNADLWLERGREFIRALHRRGRLDGRALHMEPEKAFTLHLPGFRVQGRFDRVDRNQKGFRVVDYKTGEVKEDWQLERDLQLGIYAIAAEKVFGLKPVTMAICYLDDATEIEVLKTTSQLEADRDLAGDLAMGIVAGDFTPAPAPWKCAHCDFRLVCDAAL
ncbi:MAG: ATP-dependent helicase UvrD/PcrA [Chloroflexota bacterium]|jgi:DNA helicase-2/ATP-dependent DNA helicase PcrA|nr:ATP-dependent helicase UvrD/PcrA [Chloroflexota bacterium]